MASIPGMSLSEANTQLLTVNAAIDQLLSGKRIKELKVGSNSFQRWFVYSETLLEELKSYRADLISLIMSLDITIAPTFRSNSTIPNIIVKAVNNV